MELRIEKINVSDDQFLLTALYVHSGDKVEKGDLLYSVESSKASMDVEAPCGGYLFFADGIDENKEYPANSLVAQIVDNKENPFKKAQSIPVEKDKETKPSAETVNQDVIITDEAGKLLEKFRIDAAEIGSSFISKWDVLAFINRRDQGNFGYNTTIKRVAVIGAGHAAIQVLDLISHLDGYVAVCLYDDTPEKQHISLYGVPVRGLVNFMGIKKDYAEGAFDCIINSVGTSIEFRKKCYDELTALGVPFCNLIHPTVVIGQNVLMGTGNIIHALSHIGPNTIIGNDNYITAQTSLEHHNVLGSHCTFGPGVKMSGTVTIGDCTRFASGIYVEPYIEIGENCIIASGTVITNNIPDRVVVRNANKLEIVENMFYVKH